ncbi:MAG: hypothetical protein JSY10_30450, partial [Paenibacillus sp.]|nr:hypothetical protein [Paenibacillus sp.]
IEGGHGRYASEVKENIIRIIEHGAVGINIEDQLPGGTGLYAIVPANDNANTSK